MAWLASAREWAKVRPTLPCPPAGREGRLAERSVLQGSTHEWVVHRMWARGLSENEAAEGLAGLWARRARDTIIKLT